MPWIELYPKGRWKLFDLVGRIGVRLLIVNVLVLLVPIGGLEFARIYERQLLVSLERDMKNQAVLTAEHVEAALAAGQPLDVAAGTEERILVRAARATRTRVRLLDASGALVADSHRDGPPEGVEPEPPSVIVPDLDGRRTRADVGPRWPNVPDRPEVVGALGGAPSAMTRVRGRAPAVLLFLAEPIRHEGAVAGVVYVTRSTQPVLVELYRIRSALLELLAIAFGVTAGITLVLAWSITRPIVRLSAAARRVAAGELSVPIPVSGSGEVRDLGVAFAAMKEQLVERLRFASEFSADVAHELKSPLTSIRGAAELLGEGAFDDASARERFLENIRLDVERLDQLVSRLLLLGRIEASSLPMESLDLAELARRVAVRVETPELRVVVRAPEEGVPVWGRPADLETALLNLVENAARFAPPGTDVVVELEPSGQSGGIVRVIDRGGAISEANQAKVFDRFFTTEGERGGTGLGLSIVRSVAAAHGGEVRCESAPDAGTTFTLTLGGGPPPRTPTRPRSSG